MFPWFNFLLVTVLCLCSVRFRHKNGQSSENIMVWLQMPVLVTTNINNCCHCILVTGLHL